MGTRGRTRTSSTPRARHDDHQQFSSTVHSSTSRVSGSNTGGGVIRSVGGRDRRGERLGVNDPRLDMAYIMVQNHVNRQAQNAKKSQEKIQNQVIAETFIMPALKDLTFVAQSCTR